MTDLRQALKDFVATSNSGKYADEATVLSKFPELQNYDVNVLKDFVATSNSGKYETEDELFAKFPEFNLSDQQPSAKVSDSQELKKKGGTTELPLEDGGSVLQPSKRNIPLFKSEELKIKDQAASDVTFLKKPKLDLVEKKVETALNNKSLEVEKRKAEDLFDKQTVKPKIDQSVYLKERLSNINKNLINREEEYVVPEMQYQFEDLGFKFEETGATGDFMKVVAPNGKTMEVSLDNFLDSSSEAEAKKLQSFIKNNTPQKGLFVLEKTMREQDKKFNSQKQVDDEIKKMNTDVTALNQKQKNFLLKKTEYENEIAELEKTPASQRNTEQFNSKLNQLEEQRVAMNQEVQSILNEEEAIKNKGKSLDTSVGKYTISKSKQGTWGGGIWDSFLGGIGKIASSAASTTIDIMTEVMPAGFGMSPQDIKNVTIEKAAKIGVNPPSANQDIEDWKKTLTPQQLNDWQDEMDDYIKKSLKKEVLPSTRVGLKTLAGDPDTTLEWENLKKQEFWGGAFLGLAESLPAMIGGSGPVGWAQRTAQMYAQVSDGLAKEMEEDPDFANISENEKLAITIPIGITSAVLEAYGLRNVISSKGIINSITMSALGKSGRGVGAKSFRELVENEVESRIAKGLLIVGAAGLAEGETGALQEVSETTFKAIYNEIKGKDMFETPESALDFIENVVVAGAQEAVGGFVLGVPSSVSSAYSQKGFLKMEDNVFRTFELMANDETLQSAYIARLKEKVSNGEITLEEGKNKLNNYRNSVGLFRQLPDGLTTQQKKEAMNLLKEKKDLEQYVQGKDPSLVSRQKNRINAINEELTKISEQDGGQVQSETTLDATKRRERIVELLKVIEDDNTAIEYDTSNKLPLEERNKIIEEVKSLKAEEDAVQKQATSQVPVQSGAGVSEEVAQGVPQAEPQVTAEEGITPEVKQEEIVGEGVKLVIDKEATKVRGKDHTRYAIFDSNNNEVGSVSFNYREDLDGYQIENIKVSDAGTGVGTNAYRLLINQLDKPLISDSSRTTSADAVWGKLEKEGLAKFNKEQGKYFSIKPQAEPQVITQEGIQEEVATFKPEDKVIQEQDLIEILDEPQTEASKEIKSEIDVLREQEQAELSKAIPNSDQYKVDGVIDGEKITDPADKKIFEEIYNKYDKLISPLLEQQKTEEVSSKTQDDVNKNAFELLSGFDKGIFIEVDQLGKIQPPSDSLINKIYKEFRREFNKIKIGGKRATEGAAFYNINEKTIELNKNSEHWKEIDTSNLISALAHEYVHHKIQTNENVKRIDGDLLEIKNDLIKNPPDLENDNDKYIFQFVVLRGSSPQEVMTYAVSNPEIRKYLTKHSDKLNQISQEIFNIDIIEPQKVEQNEKSTEQVQPELTRDGGRGRIDSSELTPLQGAPSVQGATGPDPGLVAVAKLYAENNGIDLKRQSEYVEVSEERAKRIANEYEKMAHDPQNQEVKEAYDELIKQTKAQYQALVDAGYKFWFLDLNKQDNLEYISSPYNAMRDLRNNKQMGVFPTTNGFGTSEIDVNDNPFLEDTGIKWGLGGIDGEMQPVLANDLFRAVHDAFGHGLEGAGFRARGEENAWQAHVRLFTGKAIGAITSETRGQNSWVNYGPYGETNRTASAEDTVFADQKTGLMPEWTWTEGRAGEMGVDSNIDVTGQVSGKLDELLSLDPKESGTGQKILDGLDRLIKDYENIEKSGLGVNIALPAIKAILKGIRSLVQAGMNLNDAIKKAAQDNNVTVRDIVNGINAVSQIAPIQAEYDALMTKADKLIKRQKSRGITDKKILSNLEAMIRKSDVYTNANDTQRKIMETEVRDKMGVGPRKSASIGRVIGVLKDITNVTRKEKLKIISRIRELSRDVAKDLTNEIRELAKEGKISATQAVNIISKLGKVNMLNEISVSNFVDYMAKVFADADYDNKINVATGKLKNARKNVASKIGIADGLMLPLQRLFSVDPSMIPEAYLDKYLELVDMFSARQAVLTLSEKSSVKKDVDQILNEINNEQSRADELAEMFAESDNKVFDEDNLDYSASLKKMASEGEITDEDLKLMKKYKQEILPQVDTVPLSEEEVNKKKSDQISEIKKVSIDSSGLPSQDEINLANRLAKLIKNTSEKDLMKLSTTDLKNLLKVADNINKNYLPHYAQIMVEKINAINSSKTLISSIKKAIPLNFSAVYSRIKSAIIRSQKGALSEMVRRNPLFNIDQVFGDFKTKDIFNSLFEKAAEGEANFKAEIKKVQNILEKAEAKVAKSFNLDPNKTLISKFKMMTYMIQLEYDSNKGSEQVNPAADYLKETIKHIDSGKSRFGERDANMLQEILKEFAPNGDIDINKLFNSFNQAEKDAINDIRKINESLKDKAQYTAAIIRGDAIDPLNNYVHLNVLHDTQPLDSSASMDFLNQANNSRKPSTKAKSLISRTKGAKPLNFDVFASAQRGAKFVLLDYNLTEPIRTARRTINMTTQELGSQGRLSKTQREVKSAIENAFEETLENLLTNSILQNSLADDAIDFISKQGYRAVLAGTGRFAAELTSNISFALLADPKAFNSGFKYKDIIMSTDAPLIMENVNSKQTNRIFPSDTLSGKFIDTSILSQASGIQGSNSKNPVFNKIQQAYNLTGKKLKNGVELVADTLISTPDKIIMRPMWFGSFANEFKSLTGKNVDFKKIAANDQSYMESNKDAIDQAKKIADQKSVFTGATDNSFMGILKGTVKPNQSVSTRAFNNFNNYMTRFLIFEYVTARTAIYALAGDGTITKTQGAALLAAVTTRMTVYTLLSQMLASGIMGLLGVGDEDEEDEKSLMQKIGQSLTSTFTSLLIGRDFGNATKLVINYGLEEINEKYLDFLREGDYDPYKDGIAYSLIPREETKKTSLSELLINMGGSFTPALKTASLIVENMSAIPEVLKGGTTKKEADAIEREERVVKERIPLEVFGHMGYIPFYKDVRRVVNKSIYASINEAKKSADRKKDEQKELLGGYENKTDLKRYNPKLYEKNFGEKSEYYKKTKDEREKEEAEDKLNREIKDRIYNYKPEDEGFGSSGFGKKEKRKNKSSKGFGSEGFGKD
jgi:hypothetical protein